MSENGQPRLTVNDPVPADTLSKLRALQDARQDLADRYLSLEQDQVRILAASRRVDDERQRVFDGLLMERGLAPQTKVEIDANTGKITLFDVPAPDQPVPAGDVPAPAQPSAEAGESGS